MERLRCRLESLMVRDTRLSFVSSPSPRYYVPGDSPWPFLGALALFLTLSGAATLVLGSHEVGAVLLSLGVVSLLAVVAAWFISAFGTADVVGFGVAVNPSFRASILIFLGVELLLFSILWGAFAFTRVGPISATPPGHAVTQGAFPVLLSSLALLLSSVALVIAQRSQRRERTGRWLAFWLAVTVVVGIVFLAGQALQYGQALAPLAAGIQTTHPSWQLLCLSVHGLHVVLALVLLTTLWVHSLKTRFTATQRFGLQALTWYWHFLEASWVTLVVLTYLR